MAVFAESIKFDFLSKKIVFLTIFGVRACLGGNLISASETDTPSSMGFKTESLENLYFRSPQFRPSKGDIQRFAILEAALDCLSKKSISAFSFQSIAERLKIRRSHIVYYFKTPDNLLNEVLRMLLAVGQDITVAHLAGAKDPKVMLEAYVEATFLWFRLYPKHAAILFLSLSIIFQKIPKKRRNPPSAFYRKLHSVRLQTDQSPRLAIKRSAADPITASLR
jgi:AcrR family transcriptional regulator